MIAVIGGSGLTQLANLQITRRQIVRTPYGEPSGPLTFGRIGEQEAVFLARHGYGHTLAPHEVNYRANLWAIHAQKVTRVVAIATVGGISANLGAGTIAVPDQIIDYTWGRPSTYFEGAEQPVTHIDFTYPYNEELRQLAHGLLPAVLTRGGLTAGVEALVSRVRLPISTEVPDERFAPEIEASAYFVVAEALTNVAKHSGAESVNVKVWAEDGALHVDVRDDGKGGARPDGSGLVGLSDRVATLGGRLRVDSPPGGGTHIAATLPLQPG